MSETYKKEIVQHIIRNLLDIQLLRIIQAQSTWGYKIKKQVETDFNIKLRHGALYPTLNNLEKKGLLRKQKTTKRRTPKKSIHHNRKWQNLPANILQHSARATREHLEKRFQVHTFIIEPFSAHGNCMQKLLF